MGQKVVIAIDPGSSKVGLALVQRDESGRTKLLWRTIASVDEMCAKIREAMAIQQPSLLIVGSGTRSKETIQRVRESFPSIGILVIDEKDTSFQARERYWEHHKRRGWRRLFPATMQVPPEPVDDFVALILAERVLHDS